MRSVTKKAHLFLALSTLFILGSSSGLFAQGKGRGGEMRGGNKPAVQRQQNPRPEPQMRQQAHRPQQRMERPQMQRQMPQIDRRAQRMERPQMQRQMPQIDRRAQRMERPQMQRQMPQIERRAQRMERPQMQRQMPQIDRRAQRMERPQMQRQMPQIERRAQRMERPQMNEPLKRGRGRASDLEKVRPQPERPDVRSARNIDRGGVIEGQIGGADSRFGRVSRERSDRIRGFERRPERNRPYVDLNQSGITADSRTGQWIGDSQGEYRIFRDRERELRRQASIEGRRFSTETFRESVYEYNERTAWRDNLFRSVISVNVGYPADYYYVPQPAYVDYYSVAYDPRFYNIGYTYYFPEYGNFYVEPYSYVYRPYDVYYGSYYYNDPYYLGDPYEDYLTYRVFASASSGGFITRVLSSLISYGYEQGYRDGLLARQAGYVDEYYDDPYLYDTVSYYEPVSFSYVAYENRRCLSEGYDLGYRDALYGEAIGYVPEYRGGDLVTLWIGATYQIA